MRVRCVMVWIAFVGLGALQAQIRSPWSGRSVAPSDTPAECPSLPQVGRDLVMDGFYRLDDPTHSIVDPARMQAYTAAAQPSKTAATMIVREADLYRSTGSRSAATCTLAMIGKLAADHAMTGRMSSSQAYYVQGWLAGAIAVAYLKVRDAGVPADANQAAVAPWLEDLGQSTRDWYDAAAKRHPEGNNHLYWAGMQLAATAAVTGSRSDLDWAYRAYRNGIAQIDKQGALPLEVARGSKALHYHLYALAPLVMIAEFGEANGADLYSERNGALRRLAAFSIAQVQNPATLNQLTGTTQENHLPLSGDAIGWAPPVVDRFQISGLATLVAQARSLNVFYLGGLPPEATGSRQRP